MSESKRNKISFETIGKEVFIFALGLSVFILSCIMILLLNYFANNYSYVSESISLPLIVVFGVTALLSALVVATMVINHYNLSNPNEALGLPRGSVRAIIALSLIIIFAIMAIYMQTQLESHYTYVRLPNGSISEPQWMAPNQSQTDFALQTLTTVSTLVVAIAAFYFGSTAVDVARGGKTAALALNPSGEISLDKNKELLITVKPTPEDESYIWKIVNDEKGSLVQERPNEFKYTPSKEKRKDENISLQFTLSKHKNVTEQLRVIIKEDNYELTTNPSESIQTNKGTPIEIRIKTSPEQEAVEWQVNGDDDKSLYQATPNLFKYTPTDPAGKEVKLIFKLAKYPEISKELNVTITDYQAQIE